jgi:hypothetical protein
MEILQAPLRIRAKLLATKSYPEASNCCSKGLKIESRDAAKLSLLVLDDAQIYLHGLVHLATARPNDESVWCIIVKRAVCCFPVNIGGFSKHFILSSFFKLLSVLTSMIVRCPPPKNDQNYRNSDGPKAVAPTMKSSRSNNESKNRRLYIWP